MTITLCKHNKLLYFQPATKLPSLYILTHITNDLALTSDLRTTSNSKQHILKTMTLSLTFKSQTKQMWHFVNYFSIFLCWDSVSRLTARLYCGPSRWFPGPSAGAVCADGSSSLGVRETGSSTISFPIIWSTIMLHYTRPCDNTSQWTVTRPLLENGCRKQACAWLNITFEVVLWRYLPDGEVHLTEKYALKGQSGT